MSRILSIHSYRGGTGKSNSTANLATLMAARGLTVGIIDTDIQSPGVHVLFGIEEDDMVYTLNDYLWGKIAIEQAAMDVTSRVGGRVMRLDVLIIDTHPGLNEETLLSIAISDVLVIILRPDQQDYQGTGVTVEVARRLEVPDLLLMVNKVPQSFDFGDVTAQIAAIYGAEVVAVLPHSDELMTLASVGIFVLRYPDHPITASLKRVVARILA